jgi:hypothetical protein
VNITPTKIRAGAHFEVEAIDSDGTPTISWRPLERILPARLTEAGVSALTAHVQRYGEYEVAESGFGWVRVPRKDAGVQQRTIAGILASPGHAVSTRFDGDVNRPATGLAVLGQTQDGMRQ